MSFEGLQVSPEQMWISVLFLTLLDVAFIWLLNRRIKPTRFRDLKWALVITSAVFWGAFALVLVQVFWDTYYQYFFPFWYRTGGILLYAPSLYAFFALAFHWLAGRLPGNPIVTFCLLSGIESLIEHLWGVYGLGILDIPLLQEVSLTSIVFLAIPEYIFYWCSVISLAMILQNGWRWFQHIVFPPRNHL